MKRYSLKDKSIKLSMASFEEDPNGSICRWADVEKLVKELEKLKNTLSDIEKEFEKSNP